MSAWTSSQANAEVVFRRFLPWFLVRMTALGALSATLLWLALRYEKWWWLLGLLVTLPVALRVALAYQTSAVCIRGADLAVRIGILNVREHIVFAWADIDLYQSLFGRIFDYGSIRIQQQGRLVEIHEIAPFHALRSYVNTMRRQPLELGLERTLLINIINQLIAEQPNRQPQLGQRRTDLLDNPDPRRQRRRNP